MTTYQIPLYRQRMVAQGALRNAQGAGEAAASSGMANAANERLARALAPAMEDLTRIEFNQAQSRQESLYAEVKAEAVKRTMTLHEGLAREALAEDTDYTTHKERSSACIVDIKKYAAEQFKGRPHLQQRFNSEVGPYIMSQDFDVRRNAVKGIAAQQIEGLSRRIQDSAAAYSLDETNNELMLSGTMQEIDRLHAAGTLSPSGAEAAKAKAWQTHDDAVIRLSIARDPEKAGQALKTHLGQLSASQSAPQPDAAPNSAPNSAPDSAQDTMLAKTVARLSPQDAARNLTQANAAIMQRDTANRQRVAALMTDKDNALANAVNTGDFSRVQKMETDLERLGQAAAAAELRQEREVYSVIQPAVSGMGHRPLIEQWAEFERVFEPLQLPDNHAVTQKVRAQVAETFRKQIEAFHNDSAGYVENNLIMREAGEGGAELTLEQRTERSFALQRDIGSGFDVMPRVLSEAQSMSGHEEYVNLNDHKKKAEFSQKLVVGYGKYGYQAAAEAKMPGIIIGMAPVMEKFETNEIASLIRASEATADSFPPISASEKNSITIAVRNTPFLRAFAKATRSTSASEEQAAFYNSIENTLVNFRRLGGDINMFAQKYSIINEDDMAIVMPKVQSPAHITTVLRKKKEDLIAGAAAINEGSTLSPQEQHKRQYSLENQYANGTWVYDGAGMALIVNGGTAEGPDGRPVRMPMAEIWSTVIPTQVEPTRVPPHLDYKPY